MSTHAIRTSEQSLMAAAHGPADLICLAATPTFAVMALLSGVLGGGVQDALCSSAHAVSPLNGMVWMYMLMSVFHSVPWLRLISGRRNGTAGPIRRSPNRVQIAG